MTGSLDAQTVRDAEQIEMALKRAAGWRPHVRDDREDAELCAVVLADALASLVASVEALTSERDTAESDASGLRETIKGMLDYDHRQMYETGLEPEHPCEHERRAIAAEARVVALTAERKQELGGDGLGADAVAQVVQAAQALVEHTPVVIPARYFYKLREAVRSLAASVGDKEPPDLTSSTTAAKVHPVQAAPDSPREDASAPEGTAT